MSDFEAVIFDLDGTVCVNDQTFSEIHAGVFERVDVEPFFEPGDMAGIDFDTLPEVESEREFYEAVYRRVAENVGGDPSHAPALAEANLAVTDHTAVSFREGAERALAAANEIGPVGLVTNGGRATQTTKLDAIGVRDRFDTAVYCDPAAGVPTKPDTHAFELALDDLGVEPSETIVVGDSLVTDVAGANAAGMVSAWVPRDDERTASDPEPDYTLESMHAFTRLLTGA